jgi:hypothetical protein
MTHEDRARKAATERGGEAGGEALANEVEFEMVEEEMEDDMAFCKDMLVRVGGTFHHVALQSKHQLYDSQYYSTVPV